MNDKKVAGKKDDPGVVDYAKLAAAATPGPWVKADFGKHEWETHICGLIFNANEEPISVDICKTITEPDAAFIAACREAVPELLDENERLKKLVDDLERKNAELEDQIDELSDAAPFGA